MCRNIRPLFNFDPPATGDEIRDAALQYVRKISGYHTPSHVNQQAFDKAVEQVTIATKSLLINLVTDSEPKDREVEKMKARERFAKRFAKLNIAETLV